MTYACQALATWEREEPGDQGSSRIYVERAGDTVALRLPGQGRIRLSAADARVVGSTLVEAAEVAEREATT